LQQELGPDQRLDARAARGLVELDGPEQVVQVRDPQRRLAIVGRGLDDLVDAVGAVDDGELGVQAQVDVLRFDCREAGSGPGPMDRLRRGRGRGFATRPPTISG
jgi:hypothetical protein